jgi:hypothetical protein
MLKVVKEVNDECAPIAESILADPDASSKQGVVSLLKTRQEKFRKRLKVPSTKNACFLRWLHAGDMNWWLLFLSTATIFFASRASQGNPIPSALVLDCTYG